MMSLLEKCLWNDLCLVRKTALYWKGKIMASDATLNISATSSDWRGVALSNFCLSPFVFDGVLLASVEGFIQGIKFRPGHALREEAFVSSGFDAKKFDSFADRSGAFWQGRRFDYGSAQHHKLIERAIRARIAQNVGLQAVLITTGHVVLVHETGAPEPPTTSLPATVFCAILTAIREYLLVASVTGPIRTV